MIRPEPIEAGRAGLQLHVAGRRERIIRIVRIELTMIRKIDHPRREDRAGAVELMQDWVDLVAEDLVGMNERKIALLRLLATQHEHEDQRQGSK